MNLAQLDKDATSFAGFMKNFFLSVSLRFVPAHDVFLNVYNDADKRYPTGGGVYVFRVAEEVVYIGKAHDFGRVYGHTGIPTGDPKQLLDCRFVTDQSLHHVSLEAKEKLRNGQFFIDCFAIEPLELCAALETFLQSVYWLRNGKHPPANRQIG